MAGGQRPGLGSIGQVVTQLKVTVSVACPALRAGPSEQLNFCNITSLECFPKSIMYSSFSFFKKIS